MVGDPIGYFYDTPQYVVANAAMRKLQGQEPMLEYGGKTDPQEALALAEQHVMQFALEDIREAARADQTTAVRDYRTMTDDEFKAAVRQIVRSSRGDQEVYARMEAELGFSYVALLTVLTPNDMLSETYAFLRSIGILSMASGALVRVTLRGLNGIIDL